MPRRFTQAPPLSAPFVSAFDARTAEAMIDQHGPAAAEAAAIEAERARDRGNVAHFCRWRQIERLIVLLDCDPPTGTRH